MNQVKTLQSLLGRQANAVCFVMDYVEVHFDGPIFRCIADPELTHQERAWRFPEPGSRDGLCELIGRNLEAVDERDGLALQLHFADGYVLTVPLGPGRDFGGESAHFVPGLNEPISVW